VCAAAPAFSSWLVVRDSPPHLFGTQGTRPSLLCVFFVVIAYYSGFFLFSLSGGWSVQRAMPIWPRVVCGSTASRLDHLVVCIFPSLLGASGGSVGALLVSPFNVKWRCYAQTGVVEESKFCLFLVVFPVRCISGISSRFYFRRHTFCFLSLAAILESAFNNSYI
jgi:hypothetical protein